MSGAVDLFGHPADPPAGPRSSADMPGLFGDAPDLGRWVKLADVERAARAELDRLRALCARGSKATRARHAPRILELSKLVNRGEAIGREELQARALASGDRKDGPTVGES